MTSSREPGSLNDQVGGDPFYRYGRLRTDDVEEAQRIVSDIYEPHRLKVAAWRALDAKMNAVQVGSLTLGYLTYQQPAQIDLPANGKWYHVNVLLRGTTSAKRSDGQVRPRARGNVASVFLPHLDHAIDWGPDTAQLAIRIPKDSVEERFRQLAGADAGSQIEFDAELDLGSPAGRSLLQVLNFATDEYNHGGVFAQVNRAATQIESLLLTSLLYAGSGTYKTLLLREHKADSKLSAEVKAYIHDHARSLPTIADLSRFAGVSARTLQQRFRESEGCGPIEYLRRVRLEGARHEMKTAEPGRTVSEIATDWGFFHLGRFSAEYKIAFGELPSSTRAGRRRR